MSDDPSGETTASTSFTQSPGKRVKKAGQRGILAIGFVLNGIYQIKRFIDRGGMGEVYEGVNVNADDDRVAVKVILPHLAADPKVQALFRKEAKTLISLAHPALVQYRVLAREPRKDLLYIVTDFIDGEPLTRAIGRTPRPTTAELVMLTRRLAEGLSAAHEHGAIHRDISPENILLPDGVLSRAKIIDFGIAKSMEIGAQTVVGDGFAGKLGYVAPEQFGDFDRRIGPWTDVYSLGLVVLALAGGKAPDMGATLVEAIDRRRAGADITVVPALLQPLFARMLSADPRGRPQTMAEVIAALDALDIPYEPPTTQAWGAVAEPPPEDAAGQAERTVIHIGSEPPSWRSAETPVEPATPPISAPEPVAEPGAELDEAPEGTPGTGTVFTPDAPLPTQADDAVDDAPEPPPVALPPEPPEPAERTVFAPAAALTSALRPGAEAPPPAEPEAEPIAPAPAPVAPDIVAEVEPEPDIPSPAPPRMDFAYGSSSAEPEPDEEHATPNAPPSSRPKPNGKLIAAIAVGAVVVAGGGFAILSSQNKGALPSAQPRTVAPRDVTHAEEAIAAALPNVPCSWLSMNRGQTSDGGVSIKIAGAAGDPVAVNRTLTGAVQGSGASGLQLDTTEVLTADQGSCQLLDAARGLRDQRAIAVPSLTALQSRFEIDRGIQGCPTGLWAQPVVNIAPDPAKSFTLVAIQPSGRIQQFAANKQQFDALAARNPDLYKDLGEGRHRVSMCQGEPGLAGVMMIEGAGPFDLGLRPGAAVRPPRDFAQRLGQLAKDKGWTVQMAWFQLANDQPDLPEQAALDPAELLKRQQAEAARKAAAELAANAAAPVVTAPAAEPEKLPADYVPCRRFAEGTWEELGYVPLAACVEKAFAGRCDVLTAQSGDIALRRYGQRLQAKTGRGFNKWATVSKSECK